MGSKTLASKGNCVSIHDGISTELFTDLGKLNFPKVVLGSRQFSIMNQLSLKMMLGLKVVKIDSKISNLLS